LKPGELKIMLKLMENEDGLTFTNIKDKTELSAPVVSEYLKNLQNMAIIIKDEERKYRLRKSYFRGYSKSSTSPIYEIFLNILQDFIVARGMQIHNLENEEQRHDEMTKFLENIIFSSIPWATGYIILKSIVTAIEPYEHKNEKEISLKVIDNLNKEINGQIEEWIVPAIQQLALVMTLNLEACHGFSTNMLDRVSQVANKSLLDFKDKIILTDGKELKSIIDVIEEIKKSVLLARHRFI